MSVLAIISTKNGAATKAGLEAASYASAWARSTGDEAVAIIAGPLSNLDALRCHWSGARYFTTQRR